MNCLLCSRKLQTTLFFYELFLLQKPKKVLCSRCQSTFEPIPPEHCPRCFKSNITDICKDCRIWEKKGMIVNHFSIFQYNTAMKDFFSNYKFSGDYRLCKVFAPHFKFSNHSYTRVPIPLNPERLKSRGFNQVTAFLEASSVSYEELLIKSNNTRRQSSSTRAERLATKNTFSIKKKAQIPQKIMVVDDIYTTGATLQQAVQILKKAGAKDIKTFSLCR